MDKYEIDYFVKKLQAYRLPGKQKFENLKITFYLSTPLCLTYPFMNIDSILGHLIFMEALARDYFITDKKYNLSQHINIGHPPYDNYKIGDMSIGRTSVGILDEGCPYKHNTIYKRFETDMANFRGKIRVGSGFFKSYCIQHITIPTTKVIFYVRGNRKIISYLIERNLTGLGKFVRIGYGKIKKIEYENTKEDYSIVKDGLAMRPIPLEMCKYHEDQAIFAYRPPYWEAKNNKLCAVPLTAVKLK